MSSEKMENTNHTEKTSDHENHNKKLPVPSKRASVDKGTVSKSKRKRAQSSVEASPNKTHSGKRHHDKHKGRHSKRPHTDFGVFKFRHGGSISDPLNLQGKDGFTSECSTCAPSPVDSPPLQLSPKRPDYFSNDPLHLKKTEKKEKNKVRSRKKRSQSSSELRNESVGDSMMKMKLETVIKQQLQIKKAKKKKDPARFCYGNYDRYYGYRNVGVVVRDPRLDLLHHELFHDKYVLDIGCNAGHVTIAIAKDFSPRCITGIDIDGNLIRNARKNVLRSLPLPKVDGKTVKFPLSIILSHGPLATLPSQDSSSSGGFPNNINFEQVGQSDIAFLY